MEPSSHKERLKGKMVGSRSMDFGPSEEQIDGSERVESEFRVESSGHAACLPVSDCSSLLRNWFVISKTMAQAFLLSYP